jgi:hypothetical protein
VRVVSIFLGEVSMATPPDPKQIVSFKELLMSQVVQQEALTRKNKYIIERRQLIYKFLYAGGHPYQKE